MSAYMGYGRKLWEVPATSALKCTKLMKVGIFLELDTLDSYPVYARLPLYVRLPNLSTARGFALCTLAHGMFN